MTAACSMRGSPGMWYPAPLTSPTARRAEGPLRAFFSQVSTGARFARQVNTTVGLPRPPVGLRDHA
jgi:hypothetical protein